MDIQQIYTYSQISNLAYIDWSPISVGLGNDTQLSAQQSIQDANAARKAPGNIDNKKLDSLGEKIFLPVVDGGEGWRVADE